MFKQIKQLFSTFNEHPAQMQEHDLKTAVAALLIEVMRADTEQQDEELKALSATLKKYFELTDTQVDELMQSASKSLDDAIDYFQFSKQINNQCSAQQRIDIVELLWRLAYADGQLDPQEEYVVRRVANLLYVTHEDFIAAKLAATKI
ncbi:TerB family tellurite resistance protein [Pseudoalteromonas sp. H105]|uniref:tellurite resistance TerB family protein n=1 Tax=Pseudoalteromonas sp. H105 TaxID=1348393 RepID=UPI0007321078|nr:TerB family tellurite resistance protein [Pseudoalteromonas sp. H105]KTF13310.1 hypothetical protein ATS75_16230 [Pseudoalteromonas sp. H105]